MTHLQSNLAVSSTRIQTLLGSLVVASCALATPAFAQDSGSSTGHLPTTLSGPTRMVPALGVSSFVTSNTKPINTYDKGFSAGIFADWGKTAWAFETGIVTLNSTAQRADNTVSATINSWGIPILGKYNFSGDPHRTFFAKAGVMPSTTTGDVSNEFNWLAVGGVGGAIPLSTNVSLDLDAAYNRILNTSTTLTNDYQGVTLLAGISIDM